MAKYIEGVVSRVALGSSSSSAEVMALTFVDRFQIAVNFSSSSQLAFQTMQLVMDAMGPFVTVSPEIMRASHFPVSQTQDFIFCPQTKKAPVQNLAYDLRKGFDCYASGAKKMARLQVMVQLSSLFNKMYALGWKISTAGSLDEAKCRGTLVFRLFSSIKKRKLNHFHQGESF